MTLRLRTAREEDVPLLAEAVLFDLDGTLLDRDSSLYQFVGDQYDRLLHNEAVDREAFLRRFIELDERGYVWKDTVYRELLKEFPISLTVQELLEDYTASFRHHCIGFPNLTGMLRTLKDRGLKLAVITNGFDHFQSNNIRALGIEPYFDVIAISEREGLRKPDPQLFLRTAGRLGVHPSACVYVGDHPVNDVAASRSAGMRGIWKVDRCFSPDFERDGEIDDLMDIMSYL